MADLRAPHAATPVELKARIEAERAGSPFLLYRDGDARQIIVSLADTQRLTVGRADANTIALPWDAELSRVHAELTLMAAEWTIADEGLSRNGTYVNGERLVGRRRLQDQDMVELGRTQILFRSPLTAAQIETDSPSESAVAPALSAAERRVLIALCRPLKDATAPVAPASNRRSRPSCTSGSTPSRRTFAGCSRASVSRTCPRTASGRVWWSSRSKPVRWACETFDARRRACGTIDARRPTRNRVGRRRA